MRLGRAGSSWVEPGLFLPNAPRWSGPFAKAAGFLLVLLIPLAGIAAPFIPATDDVVLEHLALRRNDPIRREQEALSKMLARAPQNLDVAVRLAQLHLGRARREADPRQLGQAQSALSRWWDEPAPPVAVLLLRATIRQTLHEFPASLADLRQAVTRDPRNAQAWLTLATVQQVTGDLAGARQSCEALTALTQPFIATTCTAAVDAGSGHATKAHEDLASVLNRESMPPPIRAWAHTLQAELDERLDRDRDAEIGYKSALAADPSDAYATAAYADLLLRAGRPAEARRLIPANTPSDPLLLRVAIASSMAGDADREAVAKQMRERFAASAARGDSVHMREEARFELEVEKNPSRAAALAKANWKVQKEPADLSILARAGLAAKDLEAVREVRAWLANTGLEYVAVDRMVGAAVQ